MKYIVFLIFLYSKIVFAYINIYPTEFKKNITKGATESFKLYNRTNDEIRYRIYVEEGEKNDMSQWIEIYPKSISLKPLEEEELRLAVNPPVSTPDGEYRATLVIKEVEVPKKIREDKVKLMTILKLKMKGYVGEEQDDGEKKKKKKEKN